MSRFRAFRWIGILALIPVVAIMAGCPFSPDDDKKDDNDPIPTDKYLPRTSISNVLQNLKTSYEEKNYLEYIDILAPNFTYEFDPNDVIGEDNIPDSGIWGLDDEKISAERMFSGQENTDGYRAEQITLDFTAGSPIASDINPAWRKVTLTQVNLRLDSVHAEKGTLTYLVQGDQAILHFVQTDEVDPESQQKLWQIAYWEDKPIALLAAR